MVHLNESNLANLKAIMKCLSILFQEIDVLIRTRSQELVHHSVNLFAMFMFQYNSFPRNLEFLKCVKLRGNFQKRSLLYYASYV